MLRMKREQRPYKRIKETAFFFAQENNMILWPPDGALRLLLTTAAYCYT
jgi:hypothetical protein